MPAEPEELMLRLERVLPASQSRIFELHSEPDQWARWWGPAGFTVSSIEVDLRVGGQYRILMQPPGGEAFALAGEFRRVDSPARLSYTFRWEQPDPDDQETVVDLSLIAVGDATKITVEQGPFLTDARLALHTQGWTQTLERLHQLVIDERAAS
jgi:uncharacterized protein YndB with AHSA1/START domain